MQGVRRQKHHRQLGNRPYPSRRILGILEQPLILGSRVEINGLIKVTLARLDRA